MEFNHVPKHLGNIWTQLDTYFRQHGNKQITSRTPIYITKPGGKNAPGVAQEVPRHNNKVERN